MPSTNPRLFSGKWFASLPKKEAARVEEELRVRELRVKNAEKLVQRLERLQGFKSKLNAFSRAVRTESDSIQRNIIFARLLEFNESLPEAAKLPITALNSTRRSVGLIGAVEALSNNVEAQLTLLSLQRRGDKASAPFTALSARRKELSEFQGQFLEKLKSRRIASRLGVKRLLRVSSIAAARSKRKIKQWLPRHRTRAH